MNRKALLLVGLFCLVMLIGAITVADAVAAGEDPSSDPLSGLVPAGTYCSGTTSVFDDQWASGYRLVCQNNMYVLMVDLTNPAIKAEVVAATSGVKTVSSYADANTIAVINADYTIPSCTPGAKCAQGLTISNGSDPATYTNISYLCSNASQRRVIGLSKDSRVTVDWWYKFVSDAQRAALCATAPTGGGLESYGYNVVGGGPQFAFDGTFKWNCGNGTSNAECPVSGTDVVINGERFGTGTRWSTYQSAVGYTTDGKTLVLGESNYQTHTMQDTHNIMSARLASYSKSLGNAFRFDGGSKAGFYYYKSAYSSTPAVYAPNVIRIQKTNSPCYSLTTVVSPTLAAGSVNVTTPSNCAQGLYQPNTVVGLSAAANPSYTFSNWSGGVSQPISTTTSITMTANMTVTANFTSTCYTLSTGVSPSGAGSVNVITPSNCDALGRYQPDTVVKLEAIANSPYAFSNWSGGVSDPISTTTSITMTANKSVTANFSPICYSLTTIASPEVGGDIIPSPLPNCDAKYVKGTVVQLAANPGEAYRFTDWTGAASGSNNPISVTMGADKSVTANFTERVRLYLNPSENNVTAGQVFTVEIRVALGTATADTVDAYLGFDGGLLEVVDAAGNPTIAIEPAPLFSTGVITNSVNNYGGMINFSASKYESPYLTGEFTVATIRFRAKAEGDTYVGFDFNPPRWTDVLRAGTSLEPVPSPAEVTIGPAMTLHGQVALEQRGPAGTDRWWTPLFRETAPDTFTGGIEVYAPYPTTLLGVFAEGTDVWGAFTVTLPGIAPGVYDIRVKSADTLSNLRFGVTLPPTDTIDFDTLRVGDANGDDLVDAFDVSYMVPSFLLCWDDAGFRLYANTNRDGCVNGADVSALIPNFLKAGPITIPSGLLAADRTATGIAASPMGAVSGASLSLHPTSSSVQAGEILALEIMADTGTGDADTVAAYIHFDPNLLEVVDAAGNPADAIELNAAVFSSVTMNKVNTGQIDFSATKFAPPFPSGIFKAATIRFKAKAVTPGTPVQFVRDGTRRSDLGRAGERLGAMLNNYTVQVGSSHFVYLPLLTQGD